MKEAPPNALEMALGPAADAVADGVRARHRGEPAAGKGHASEGAGDVTADDAEMWFELYSELRL